MAVLSTASFFNSPLLLKPTTAHSLSPFHISVSAPQLSLIHHSLSSPFCKSRRTFAVAEEKEQQEVILSEGEGERGEGEGEERGSETTRSVGVRPCELFVCNLPRSCDVAQLLELFSPFGTVNSVEVSRDTRTGLSKGCGFVTMNSYLEAREAISALDGSDLSGRQILVKLKQEPKSKQKNPNLKSNMTKRDMVYESPFKIYIGNLAWTVQPEHLKEHFSKYGSVISSRLVHDKKDGKHRVYGFVSFSNEDERLASLVSSRTMFHGREMTVRVLTAASK